VEGDIVTSLPQVTPMERLFAEELKAPGRSGGFCIRQVAQGVQAPQGRRKELQSCLKRNTLLQEMTKDNPTRIKLECCGGKERKVGNKPLSSGE